MMSPTTPPPSKPTRKPNVQDLRSEVGHIIKDMNVAAMLHRRTAWENLRARLSMTLDQLRNMG